MRLWTQHIAGADMDSETALWNCRNAAAAGKGWETVLVTALVVGTLSHRDSC